MQEKVVKTGITTALKLAVGFLPQKIILSMQTKIKYKLRCRKNGIVVSDNLELFDIVWKRIYNEEIFPMDNETPKRNYNAIPR